MYDTYRQVWNELIAEGAPFHIEEIEVRGSSMRVYSNAPTSLREIWLASTVHDEAEYLVYGEERWTYNKAHRDVASISNWLQQQGVVKGDRVSITMRNFPEWLLCYWACVATGITVVGMNAWWVEDEMEYGLNDAAPKVLFTDSERLQRFLNIRENFTEIVTVGIRLAETVNDVFTFDSVVATGGPLPTAAVDPDSDACIFYTSGTTGYPKGAQLTHRGCVHNVLNLAFAANLSTLTQCRLQGAEPPDPRAATRSSALVTTPLFH
ncbi:MAG: long-chain fatty acid--CoA ligase, partial [Pseudomonadales bacterium]|nr:long-chain fatty acid--CoA ligase [Pseudomonadales bacterium]